MARGVQGESVRVEGLRELQRSLQKIRSDLKPEITKELKDIGQVVADRAQSFAIGQGLYDSGNLADHIKSRAALASVAIVDTANRDGYPYPRIYEYGHGGARAFMRPALIDKQGEVIDKLDRMLARLGGAAGF